MTLFNLKAAIGALAAAGFAAAADPVPPVPVPCPPAPVVPFDCPPGAMPGGVGQPFPGGVPGGIGQPFLGGVPGGGQPFPGGAPQPGGVPLPPVPVIAGNNNGQPAQPDAPAPAEGTGSTLAASAATRSGNMMGDLLAARSLRIGYSVPIRATFGVQGPGSGGVVVNPNIAGGSVAFGPTPNGTNRAAFSAFTGTDLRYTQTLLAGNPDLGVAQAALQTLISTGQLSPALVQQLNKLSAADRAALLSNRGAINALVTNATRGLTIPNPTLSSLTANLAGGTITYTGVLTGEQVVALPGSSSTVGRVKLAEDNSPLPRDRIIFNYDYFDGVPFSPNGLNVNRFQFGVEKTFLDGRWSGEVRLPFASTLASTYTQGAEFRDVVLGNLRFALKRLAIRGERLNVSTGVGVTLPTAPDQVVNSVLGGELYRFRNQSVTVEPYIAALFTPNDRLFMQAWTSVNFDTSGGELRWNPAVFGGSGSAHIWDIPYLAVDGQVGYWLVQNTSGRLRGLAPFVELHWNYAIAQTQLLRAVSDSANGLGLTVNGIANTELNMTAGFLMQFGENTNVTVGASVPLFQKPDRTFDAQFGVRLNYYFGRTAQARSGLSSINGF